MKHSRGKTTGRMREILGSVLLVEQVHLRSSLRGYNYTEPIALILYLSSDLYKSAPKVLEAHQLETFVSKLWPSQLDTSGDNENFLAGLVRIVTGIHGQESGLALVSFIRSRFGENLYRSLQDYLEVSINAFMPNHNQHNTNQYFDDHGALVSLNLIPDSRLGVAARYDLNESVRARLLIASKETDSPYNKACFQALLGKEDEAIESLRESLSTFSGLPRVSICHHAANDPDLKSLHTRQEFWESLSPFVSSWQYAGGAV